MSISELIAAPKDRSRCASRAVVPGPGGGRVDVL